MESGNWKRRDSGLGEKRRRRDLGLWNSQEEQYKAPKFGIQVSWPPISDKLMKTGNLNEIQSLSCVFSIT